MIATLFSPARSCDVIPRPHSESCRWYLTAFGVRWRSPSTEAHRAPSMRVRMYGHVVATGFNGARSGGSLMRRRAVGHLLAVALLVGALSGCGEAADQAADRARSEARGALEQARAELGGELDRAQARVDDLVAEARDRSGPALARARARAQRTVRDARAQADRAIADARDQGRPTAEIESLRDEARRRLAQLRKRVERAFGS